MNKVADALTLARMVLVVILLGVGSREGVAALPAVVVLTVACWVTDVLDGKLARQAAAPTRLGRYDVAADLGLALSLAICLVLWGVLPPAPVVIVVVVATVCTRLFHFLAPQKFAMGMAYAALIFSVWRLRPGWLWVLVGGLGLLILLNPQRAWQQVEDFLNEVGDVFRQKGELDMEKESRKER